MAVIREFYRGAIAECLASRDLVHWVGAELRGEKVRITEREPLVRAHPEFHRITGLRGGGSFRFAEWRELIDEALPARWRPYMDPSRIP